MLSQNKYDHSQSTTKQQQNGQTVETHTTQTILPSGPFRPEALHHYLHSQHETGVKDFMNMRFPFLLWVLLLLLLLLIVGIGGLLIFMNVPL
jgi:hypothetical protein